MFVLNRKSHIEEPWNGEKLISLLLLQRFCETLALQSQFQVPEIKYFSKFQSVFQIPVRSLIVTHVCVRPCDDPCL